MNRARVSPFGVMRPISGRSVFSSFDYESATKDK